MYLTYTVNWLYKDDAIYLLPSHLPTINDEWFRQVFGKCQASCLHCLQHIKSGSYNFDDLRVTLGLKDNMALNKDLMVIHATYAPSMLLSDKKLYSVEATFQ